MQTKHSDSAPDRARSAHAGIFVTGTDTDVGKTWVSLGIMAALQGAGISTIAMKPVASGCLPTEQGLRNDDAERLMAQSSVPLPYELVNPFAFEPAIAPHIAAAEAGRTISLEKIESCYHTLTGLAQCCVVEGAGGWLVPLTDTETAADLVARLGLPIILVVGIRLGCINHTLLSVESILRAGHNLLGWVANCPESGVERGEENILALTHRIDAPLLARIPWSAQPCVPEFAKRIAVPGLCRTGILSTAEF
uniref:ATP-dependent dethiobiotin synthetase BioD n=1 Tax=Candidatus Kentrum sp. FM TaxID=2126340 RepID=A0A450WKI6_9GAMM|nr:MAG: dethiobiotin synthetase [Candidatus Kentron sp. FM]VFJ77479.1 MAG: dethiobiotin synthetase [Candidatus Kentron sp. FM]VFK17529.1 MAG: dethiobiotin synthetase [Candidatus Kentron sp. FM]